MPTALGGKGGGVTTDIELVEWMRNRLQNFPTLPDLSSAVSMITGTDGVDVKKVSVNITGDCETVSESGTVN